MNDKTTAGQGALCYRGGRDIERTPPERIRLFADRFELKAVPVLPADGQPPFVHRSPKAWEKHLGGKYARDDGYHVAIPSRVVHGSASRLYMGSRFGGQRYEVRTNPIRLLRYQLIEEGRYSEDAPLGYGGHDNFVDPSRLIGCGLTDLHQQQMTLIANMVNAQTEEAARLMRLAFSVSAEAMVITLAEFVHDLPVKDAHCFVRSMETTFRSMTTTGSLGWARGTSSLKAKHDDYDLTIYTKTPSLVRFQVRFNKARDMKRHVGSNTAPATAEGWAELFRRVEFEFGDRFLALMAAARQERPETGLNDLLLAISRTVGHAKDTTLAREFLDQLRANGVINNEGRRFKAMVDRGCRAGLLEKGAARGQWVLARRFEFAAMRLVRTAGI